MGRKALTSCRRSFSFPGSNVKIGLEEQNEDKDPLLTVLLISQIFRQGWIEKEGCGSSSDTNVRDTWPSIHYAKCLINQNNAVTNKVNSTGTPCSHPDTSM